MTFADLLKQLREQPHVQLFLCNLKLALDLELLDAAEVRKTLRLEPARNIGSSDPDSILGNLKAQTHESRMQQLFRHAAPGVLDEFVGRGGIVTVIDARHLHHYRHPDDFTGHDFNRPQWVSRRFRPDACTYDYFWAAPSVSCAVAATGGRLADTLRDLLGLVHHGRKKQLIAISLRPPVGQRSCRPTIMDALPNERFLQNHHDHKDPRWGYTVDLHKLDTVAVGEPIAGAPELLFEKVFLRDCSDVELRALGSTTTSRVTARSGQQFLLQMQYILRKRGCGDVYSELEAELG